MIYIKKVVYFTINFGPANVSCQLTPFGMKASKPIVHHTAQLSLFNPLEDSADPTSGAVLSTCGLYRYALWRFWEGAHQTYAHRAVLFVCLNPSTADARQDDPTIRRCRRFAQDWGYPGMIMLNLFAYRATDPGVMRAFARTGGDAVGPDNDAIVRSYLHHQSGMVVCAWGADGGFMGRNVQMEALIRSDFSRPDQQGESYAHCLGKTKAGYPRHPLFVASSQLPQPYRS